MYNLGSVKAALGASYKRECIQAPQNCAVA